MSALVRRMFVMLIQDDASVHHEVMAWIASFVTPILGAMSSRKVVGTVTAMPKDHLSRPAIFKPASPYVLPL